MPEEWRQYLRPMPDHWRQILEPLTDRQLTECVRQVRWDRHEHVRAKHSPKAYPLSWHLLDALEVLAERPVVRDQHEVFMTVASDAVSEYWSHVTDGHRRHAGSVDRYLRWLVRRIQRGRFTLWVKHWDRHVVRVRGGPSVLL